MRQVRRLFRVLDADGDGLLNKAEYRKYLEAVGLWGLGDCTEKDYDAKGWPKVLSNLGTTAERGIDVDSFWVLYAFKNKKRRDLQDDVKKCKAVCSAQAAGVCDCVCVCACI